MRSEARVTYMAYPRAAALAEVAWSPPERINWEEFEKRLEPQLRRYATLGIGYARETPVVPGPRRRVSHDLEQCGGGYLLSLEDDAPLEGERAVFLVNITDPCWIWRGVDLSQVKAIRATVGPDSLQLPDRRGCREDSAAQARDEVRRAARSASTTARARWWRARRWNPPWLTTDLRRCPTSTCPRRKGSTTSASRSRGPRSIPSGRSAASSSLVSDDAADHPRSVRRLVCAAGGDSRRGLRARLAGRWRGASIPRAIELRSPCDGEVISVAASRHALALRATAGAEILVHVGVDTVGLAGEGFNVHVRKGDRVRAGDLLLTFDLDLLARKAPSLMTPVIVTNADRFRISAGEHRTRWSPAATRCSRSNSSRPARRAIAAEPAAEATPCGQRSRRGRSTPMASTRGRRRSSRVSPRPCPTKSSCALADAARAPAAPWR